MFFNISGSTSGFSTTSFYGRRSINTTPPADRSGPVATSTPVPITPPNTRLRSESGPEGKRKVVPRKFFSDVESWSGEQPTKRRRLESANKGKLIVIKNLFY